MTEHNPLNKPQPIPKPYRVSKMNQNTLLSSEGSPLPENSSDTKPTRIQVKKATTIGLQKANYSIAIQRANLQSNRYYKGQQIPITTDQQHFKIYGPGIYLFFAFIWKLSSLFLVLTLISLLPMIYNYLSGTRFSNSIDSLDIYISRVSVSNFYGDDPSLTSAQQVSNTRVPKLINCISDLVSMFIVMVFYFYWTGRSQKITQQIKKTFKLANYHTLELRRFHQDTTDYDVYRFFCQFGMVTQVAPVKNYSQTIQLSKQIYQCETEIKQLTLQGQQQQKSNGQNKYKQKINKLQQKLDKLYKQLYKQERKSSQETIKYYVTFSTPLQRASTLKKFNKMYDSCCLCLKTIPQQYLLKGQQVQVTACHDQPGEIIWQNVHVTWKTRWMRALFQFIVLLVVVFVGFFVISTLDVITPPSTLESIDTSSYTTTSILLQTNATIVQSWCLKNTAIATSPSTQLTSICQPYITRYYINLVITYSITFFVILIKTLLKKLVIWIAKFQRYTQHTQQSIDVMKNLVIIYIITTVVIGFLLQANLFGIQFKNIVPQLVNNSTLKSNASLMTDYSTLENNWYIDIGYQIWLTWLILAVTPHSCMPLYYYLMECLNKKLAQSQKLQKTMQTLLQPVQFQVQDHYANIIMIFLIGIVFSGGMPCMIVVSFVGIITRYCYLKFLFIRFCKVPNTIDQHLNNAVLSYFPWGLGCHFLMTIWMYSVPSIFAFEQSIFSTWYQQSSSIVVQFISKALGMMVASYYYTIVAVIIMFIVIMKQLIYDYMIANCRNKQDPHDINQQAQISASQLANSINQNIQHTNKQHGTPIIASQRGLTNSYRIQNNPDYFEILSIKQNMKKKILNGQFQDNKLKDIHILQN